MGRWGIKNGFGVTVGTYETEQAAELICRQLNEDHPELKRNKWKADIGQFADPWFYVVSPEDLDYEQRVFLSR